MDKRMMANLGEVNQIPIGQGRCFVVQGEEVAVFRTRSGGIFALENQCPHRKGPLSEGVIGDGKVICPLHGHKFDLATGKGVEPQECVKTFKAWEEHGEIFLKWEALSKIPTPACAV